MRFAIALLLFAPVVLHAQDSTTTRRYRGPSHWHVGITYHDYGVTVGNAARTNGLRLNFEDADLDVVNGVNVTIWKPREPLTGTINGLALGVAGPGAEEINGIGIGVGGVVAERRARWITIGGLGAVSNGRLEGLAIGGLGTVANRDIVGIAIGGLGTVANHDLTGFAFGGLGTVANGNITGIAIAGLGTVANRDLTGIAIAGLGTVADGNVTGIAIGGLATVANGDIRGVGISGLATVTDRSLTGLGIGGVSLVADKALRGVGAALYVKTWELHGVSIAGYNRVRGAQVGLTVGIYNSARVLKGVQLGVINRAQNNHGILKILPLINAHF